MSPTRAKVGDTVRITVQGFQVGSPGVSAWGFKEMKGQAQASRIEDILFILYVRMYVYLVLFALCQCVGHRHLFLSYFMIYIHTKY